MSLSTVRTKRSFTTMGVGGLGRRPTTTRSHPDIVVVGTQGKRMRQHVARPSQFDACAAKRSTKRKRGLCRSHFHAFVMQACCTHRQAMAESHKKKHVWCVSDPQKPTSRNTNTNTNTGTLYGTTCERVHRMLRDQRTGG